MKTHKAWCRALCRSLAQGIRCGLHDEHECTCRLDDKTPGLKANPYMAGIRNVLWHAEHDPNARALLGTPELRSLVDHVDALTAHLARLREAAREHLRSLDEFTRQSMYANPEWRGIETLEKAVQASLLSVPAPRPRCYTDDEAEAKLAQVTAERDRLQRHLCGHKDDCMLVERPKAVGAGCTCGGQYGR